MTGFAAIPAELRERPQWVVWKAQERDGKRTKVPYRADGAGGASTTDPATWANFDMAVAGLGGFDGIGFVFSSDDPYCGIDLDDGLTVDDRVKILETLNSYSEWSVSGRGGLHVIVRAGLNGHPRNRRGPFEVYDSGRYFVVTGDHVAGTPKQVMDRDRELHEVLERFLPAPKETSVQPSAPVGLDDRELLDRAMEAKNGREFQDLWEGRWETRHSSHSEADLALAGMLAFWAGGDADRVDRLFRSSGLMREKWLRENYRQRTLNAAINGRTDFYKPTTTRPTGRPAQSATSERTGLQTVRADQVTMRSIEWLDKPFLQRAAFHLASGPKGVGKGTWLAKVAAAITRGAYAAAQNVVFITTEDSIEIDVVPRLTAAEADLARIEFVTDSFVLPEDICRLEQHARAVGDVGLIAIDPLSNHIGGADTDKEGAVRHAVAKLNQLAVDIDCVVIGVRHPGKNRKSGALLATLGSTAWVDLPRAVIAFARDDEDEMMFHAQVVAGNRSGRSSAEAFRIELVDVGLKEPVTRAVALGESTKSVDDLLLAAGDPKESRTQQARDLILDILEKEGEQESDALDARVARETGLTAKTVQNVRVKLGHDGLLKPVPDKDETGAVKRWLVRRTGAPRP